MGDPAPGVPGSRARDAAGGNGPPGARSHPRGKPRRGLSPERRTSGLIRVPFVRRCVLDLQGIPASTAFLVNINVLGAYVARDDLPVLGHKLTCRFQVPDSEHEVVVEAVVAWLNPKQQHLVHSLPPGFGIKFEDLSPESRTRIERLVQDHLSRYPESR